MALIKNRNGALVSHALALVTILAWGVSFVSTKVLLNAGLHPTEVYIYRFGLAYLVILAFCHKKLFANNWHDEVIFALIGLSAGTIYYLGENFALRYTLVTNVSLLTSTCPLLTVLLCGLLYKNERPTRGAYAGSFVAMAGAGLVVFNSFANGGELQINPLGDFLAIFCAFAWAVYSIILRKVNATYSTIFITRKTFFYGVLFALPILAVEPQLCSPLVLIEPEVLGNLLFLALVCSIVGFYTWAAVVKSLGAVKANNYLYFQPIVTLIFGALILGEAITIIGVSGCLLILVGVWLFNKLG